jgi:anhydro-N-acetylmuramic acid kinase
MQTLIIGLMSGTSVDAIDVAICRFEEDTTAPGDVTFELVNYSEQPHDPALRARVFQAFEEKAGPAELCELNFALGEAFAQAAVTGLAGAGISSAEIDLVASHGQTIYHQVAPGHLRSSLQMAEAAVIAERTGVTVAHDFRTGDIAAGGQGAPLVPYLDLVFFAHPERYRVLLNIGGIGNVTFLPPGGKNPLALDTGPGNSLLDYAARHFSGGARQYDKNGELAATGNINPFWLNELLRHPYFELAAPKSTGRELFGDAFARNVLARAAELGLSPKDTLATLTAFSAKSIAQSVRRFNPTGQPIQELIVGGGGARNLVLMEMLGEWLPAVEVTTPDALGVVAEAKEAVAFALLGYELLRNRPANVPACTGAAHPVRLGKLTPGSNWYNLWQKFAPHMYKENDPRWQTLPRLSLKNAN